MKIIDPDNLAADFIKEWESDRGYITAHTSGSTGKPKEIKLKKSDMLHSAEATCRFFNLSSQSTLVLPLSPDYIAGKMMIVRAIVSDATLYIERASNTPLAKDYGVIDLLPVVPSQLHALLSDRNPDNIRNLLIGGGAISPALEKELAERGWNAFASYGMTETCSHIALRNIRTDGNIFTTLPCIEVGCDERGCLEINRHPFSFGKLVTNDIIELHDSTRFEWKGRFDNVINSGGIKIFPEECERILSAGISKPFYITGRQHEKWGEEAVLYIEDPNPDKDAIMKYMKSVLPRHKVPHEIIGKEHFERTSSGKIKRTL